MKNWFILFAIVFSSVLTSSCLKKNPVQPEGTEVVVVDSTKAVDVTGFITINPDSGVAKQGGTFRFTAELTRFTDGDTIRLERPRLSVGDLNLLIENLPAVIWQNRDRFQDKEVLLQVNGNVGDTLMIPVMYLPDDEVKSDTLLLIIAAPDAEVNNSPIASLRATQYSGVAPFIANFRVSYSDPDPDDVLSGKLTTANQVIENVQDGQSYDFTFTTPGEHEVTLLVSDGTDSVSTSQTVVVLEQQPTTLEVTTDPEGCLVVLTNSDTTFALSAPIYLDSVQAGDWRAVVSKDGYITGSFTFVVTAHQANSVAFSLQPVGQPSPTRISIGTDHISLNVRVTNGLGYDTTVVAPITFTVIDSGVYRLYGSKEGYQDKEVLINVLAHTNNVYELNLDPLPSYNPSINGDARPASLSLGQTTELSWVGAELLSGSVEVRIDGSVFASSLNQTGELPWTPSVAGSYVVVFSGVGLDSLAYTDTVDVEVIDQIEPDILVTPMSWDYDQVQVGEAATKGFVVTNRGNGALVVDAPTLSGGDFAIASGSQGITLAPGETANITVQFAPMSAGQQSATLYVTSNDPDQSMVEVQLQGEGYVPVPPCRDDTLRYSDKHIPSHRSDDVVEYIAANQLDGKVSITSQVRNEYDDSLRAEFYVELVGSTSATVYAVAYFDTLHVYSGQTMYFRFFDEADIQNIGESTKIIVHNVGPSNLTFRQVVAHCGGNDLPLVIDPSEYGVHLHDDIPVLRREN